MYTSETHNTMNKRKERSPELRAGHVDWYEGIFPCRIDSHRALSLAAVVGTVGASAGHERALVPSCPGWAPGPGHGASSTPPLGARPGESGSERYHWIGCPAILYEPENKFKL